MEGGAVIINVTFSTSRSQDASILPELTSVFDAEWKSGVVQPAYSLKFIGSVVSFFLRSSVTVLEICILSVPERNLCTTPDVLLWPPLQTTTAVIDAADTPPEQPEDKRQRRNFDVIASEESDDECLLAAAIAYERTFASHAQQQLQ